MRSAEEMKLDLLRLQELVELRNQDMKKVKHVVDLINSHNTDTLIHESYTYEQLQDLFGNVHLPLGKPISYDAFTSAKLAVADHIRDDMRDKALDFVRDFDNRKNEIVSIIKNNFGDDSLEQSLKQVVYINPDLKSGVSQETVDEFQHVLNQLNVVETNKISYADLSSDIKDWVESHVTYESQAPVLVEDVEVTNVVASLDY